MSGYQWKIGEKAACIRYDWQSPHGSAVPPYAPKVGEIFTVRAAAIDPEDGVLMLVFDEIDHEWDAENFRPLVKRKTDISVFKAMLKTEPEAADG